MQDSEDGSKQYRAGYVHALRAVSEFLIGESQTCIRDSQNAAVKRLFAFSALQRNPQGDAALLARSDRELRRDTVEFAAEVLRRGDENADFLNWWLHTYGTQALSPAGHSACPIFPDYPRARVRLNSICSKTNLIAAIRKCRRSEGSESAASYERANQLSTTIGSRHELLLHHCSIRNDNSRA